MTFPESWAGGWTQKPTREDPRLTSKPQQTVNMTRVSGQRDSLLIQTPSARRTPPGISNPHNLTLHGSDVFLPDGLQLFQLRLIPVTLRTRGALPDVATQYFSTFLLKAEQAEHRRTLFLHPHPPRSFLWVFFLAATGSAGAADVASLLPSAGRNAA